MARPLGGKYKLADGTIVPSVTTVLSRFKNCGPLIYWAWKEGSEGRDFRDTRDKAGSIGSCAHAMVEAEWRNQPFDRTAYTSDIYDAACKSFDAYQRWAAQTKLCVVEGERPLVSEIYKYGGTPDAIMVNGELALGDWKTSSGIYAEYLIQIAAYGQLWNENNPTQPLTGGFHLLRFDKQHGDFTHRFFQDLTTAWEAFKLMVPLYNYMKELDKRAR